MVNKQFFHLEEMMKRNYVIVMIKFHQIYLKLIFLIIRKLKKLNVELFTI
jgi:hypothetical protein